MPDHLRLAAAGPRDTEATARQAKLSRPDLAPRGSVRPSVRKDGNVLWLKPAEDVAFKHFFAAFFAKWLQDNYARPEHVAAAFGVRSSTAYAWWNGDNRASGDMVLRAAIDCPAMIEQARAAWRGVA